jgi:hypothetical protein
MTVVSALSSFREPGEMSSHKRASSDASHLADLGIVALCRLLDTVRFHPRAKGRSQCSLYGAWL